MSQNFVSVSFSVLFEAIKQARYNALKTVNAELVNLYWQVGAFVSKQLKQSQWGDKTVQNLSDFLLNEDPSLKGFDRKSIYRMVQFYESYCTAIIVKTTPYPLNATYEFVTSPGRQLVDENHFVTLLRRQFFEEDIRDTLLTKLSWTHHRTIFSRCKTEEEREFYLRLCIQENYSVRELERQINSGTYERIMIGDSILSEALKKTHASSSHTFKDIYVFEFLNLPEPHNEKDLQKALVGQMRNFILELGKDFLFMGEEYKIQVGNSDFFIDLLFYHRGLQCMVAFELKADKFKPGHLGQLNFYLEALDRDIKKTHENPSIGVLLCKDKDSEVVEYALSRSLSPAMVSEYKTQLPDKRLLQQKLHEIFTNL